MTLTTKINGNVITASYFNDIKTDIEALEADLAATDGTTSDDFSIGDGTDTTKSLTANNADANKPKLRYNHTTNAWEFSNNGVDYTAMGGGGSGSTLVTKTSDATLATTGEDIILADATSGSVTLTLPAASSNSGLTYKISKIDSSSNEVTIDGNSSETIDGDLTTELYGQYNSIQISCNGSNWFTIKNKTRKTCILKEVAASGTNAGTFTSGSYVKRNLTNVEGDADIVSLSSGQFTLQAGIYIISGSAPAFQVYQHKTVIYNATDANNDIRGTAEFSSVTNPTQTRSHISGTLVLTAAKVFEFMHRCATTSASNNGLGVASAFGEQEIYAQLEIIKVV